ncbi:hypothetical protein Tco_0841911 [Tanacetum coccineum]|uniref:DUF4283 domain-containing protein n=1 Tax=Tanacetum coccineum TaxID=301880 RepID=A0ABQ5B3C9_9ASTR
MAKMTRLRMLEDCQGDRHTNRVWEMYSNFGAPFEGIMDEWLSRWGRRTIVCLESWMDAGVVLFVKRGALWLVMRVIFYNDALTFEVALSCEPTVSPLNNNQIDFRISFDESDDEDYTRFSDEFPAIAYNNALTSKLDFSPEPTVFYGRRTGWDSSVSGATSDHSIKRHHDNDFGVMSRMIRLVGCFGTVWFLGACDNAGRVGLRLELARVGECRLSCVCWTGYGTVKASYGVE